MIDESDLLDPGKNSTQSESQPFGVRIPEFVLCQLIGFGLKNLRLELNKPHNLIDELFRMYGQDVIAQIKGYLRDHPNIKVQVNWPREDIGLPFVAVVNAGEDEASNFTFMGDYTGINQSVLDGRPTAREQYGMGMNTQLNIFIGSPDPNLTMYLHHLVKFIVVSNKRQLTEMYDLHDIIVGGRDLQHETSLFPTFGYMKMVTFRCLNMLDYNVAEEAAKIVSLNLLVAGHNTSGVEVDVSVPSPDDDDV